MARWRKIRRRKKYNKNFTKTSASRSRKLMLLAKIGPVGLILFFVGTFLVLPIFAFNLHSPDKIVRRDGFSTKIFDRNGVLLYDIFADQKRTPVDVENIPEYLKQATVSIEDRHFYDHQGFDPFGMARGISRVFTRGYAQGGSTLTQQLVKNVLLTPERTIMRKIREFILSVQIEQRYSKNEILQMYLNEAPYGGTAWGVGSAAETYFGKDVSELNLVESAFVAGLPQRPSVYSPYSSSPEAYKGRTKDVLRRMREDGYISTEEEEEALEQLEELEFKPRGDSFKAPHFVQYVQEKLIDRYGERVVEQGGLRVTTTLDLELQEKTQQIVADEIAKVENLKITNGAAIVVNPQTGEILAMVGSKNFYADDYDGQVNVTLALRQPGSAIKPITYVTGLKKGYTASTLLMDVPTEFYAGQGQPLYMPVNYDGSYRGPIQVRQSLANSINVTAVKMLAMVGLRDMLATAYDMGITTMEPSTQNLSRLGLSATLGGGEVRLLELTTAYSAFLNEGYRVDPVSILKVEDSKGKLLEQNKPERGNRVLSPEEAYLIADILSDNDARSAVFGVNSLLNIAGRDVAVKTGTTNDRRDNWAVGGSPQSIVGVWVGNNDNSPMTAVASGISGASPIWRQILMSTLDGKEVMSFNRPGGIIEMQVDAVTGYRAKDGFASRTEIFIDGTQPGEDPVHVNLRVCRTEGKLATPADISSGNYEEKAFFVFKEEDPVSPAGSENLWQKGILAWLQGQSDPRYNPPNEYCGSGNPLSLEFHSPGNEQSNLSNKFTVDLRARSIHNIKEVQLYVNNSRVITMNNEPFRYELDLENGTYQLKAVAQDAEGNERTTEIKIGVGVAWDFTPASPTPVPTNTPAITPEEED